MALKNLLNGDCTRPQQEGDRMAREDLIPVTQRTKEEAKILSRKGGINSGKTRRAKKSMRESLAVLLTMPMKQGKSADLDAIRDFASLKGKNITVEQAMLIAQIQKALKGDTQALAFLRDTSGQKPDDNLNVSGNIPVIISGEEKLED